MSNPEESAGIYCIDCKFWDGPSDLTREEAASAELPYPELNGICMRSYGYSDIHPGEFYSMASAYSVIQIPAVRKEDGQEIFLDGTPFNEMDARRLMKQEDRQLIISWLGTNPFFSCNQSLSKEAECPEQCDHCLYTNVSHDDCPVCSEEDGNEDG